MLEAVIFDMDGVLVDSEREYKRVELRLAKELGIPFAARDQSTYVGMHHHAMWTEVLAKNGMTHLSADEISQTEEDRLRDYYEIGALDVIAQSVALAERLFDAGIKCGLATSSSEANANAVVKRLGIEKKLGAVVCGCMVAHCKPAPDIYSKCADDLCVSPENCVAIEDSRNGCISAKAAGCKVIGFVNRNSGIQDLSEADVVVSDIRDVTIALLESLFENGE